MAMYKVSINETSYKIDLRGDDVLSDNELLIWDLVSVGDYLFHLISDSKSYVIEIITN